MAQPASLQPSSPEKGPELQVAEAPQPQPWERALPWVVFVAAAIVLCLNVAPGVTFHDSGEFALAAKVGGVPHPPGAPTWTLAAWGFTSLLPMLDAAYATNLLCALYGAGALGVFAWLGRVWISRAYPDLPAGWLSLAPPLVLLCSPAFLEQCFVTEQYTLLLLLNGVLLMLGSTGLAGRSFRPWHWAAMGVVFGLAVGNHPSQIVLGPLLLVMAWMGAGRRGFWQAAGYGALGLLAGLCVFFYAPLRAATDPVMNWGRADDWGRFLWGITREQWESRPISSAPAGFAAEWMRSFDLPGQLGWAGLAFAAAGLAAFAKRAWQPLAWMALAVVPYAAVLLLGHMGQDGMDNVYVRFYGVIDWHLPVYAMGAVAAMFGLAAAVDFLKSQAAWLLLGTALAFFGVMAGLAVSQNSLAGSADTKAYLENSLNTLPKDAILFTATDNGSHPMAYARYGAGMRPDIYVAYGYPMVDSIENRTLIWGPRQRRKWLLEGMRNWKFQPLDLPPLTEADLARPLFMEYPPATPAASAFLLPAGWSFLVSDTPVGNAEVLAADADWQKRHPELFAVPKPGAWVHRLTREAFSQVHQRRGNYFTARKLHGSAIEAYKLALAWQPENPQIWYGMAYAYEESGSTDDAARAFLHVFELMPSFPGVKGALGLVELRNGNKAGAYQLMKAEVDENPDDKVAAANYERLSREMGRAR